MAYGYAPVSSDFRQPCLPRKRKKKIKIKNKKNYFSNYIFSRS